jgi:hypothetical protein
MAQLRVSEAAVAAAGRALVQLGPVPPWQRWIVARVTVGASGGDPEARLYRGSPGEANLLGGTYSGRLDTYDPAQPVELLEGQSLVVEWTRATNGSVCTATATGERS